ncbi:putative ribonuclease H-like domain-containing protein, partial [Tanacetum coccineum]
DTTAEEKQDGRNEMKARGTLLMALPNKDQLRRGMEETRNPRRLQKLISQLEIQGEVITQEDMNIKLLRSLPSEWKTHVLIWRNKEEIETIRLDDLYNNLKIYEPKISGSSSTSQNPQNVAFVSSNSTNSNSSTNEADNTAYGVSAAHTQSNPTSGDNLSDAAICAFLVSRPNSPQISQQDLEQINLDDLEEIDLQWEIAMLTIRAWIFIKRTCRKLDVNGQRVRFDRSKVECYNCHKYGHFARECRALRNQESRGRKINRRIVIVETPTENALVAQDGIGGYDWSYQAEEEHPKNSALMALTSLGSSSSSDFEVDSCSKTCVKAYATLKEQYDNLSSDYKKSQFNLVSYKAGLESVEARLAHYKKNEDVYEESINVLNLEVKLRDNVLIENKKKLEKAEKKRDELKLTLEKFQNSFKTLNNLLESQVSVKFKTGLGYNTASSTVASPAVESFVNSYEMLENQENNKSKSDKEYHAAPPPFTGNFMPRKPDLTFIDEIVKIEPKTVRKNNFRPPVIEDWNSDDESEVEIIPKDKTVSSSTEKIKLVKSVRETVAKVETSKQNKHYPRGNQRNWNNLMSQRLGSDFKMINKACFVCGSFENLHYVCDKKVIRPLWNNTSRVNHKNFANKMTHPHLNRRFVPLAVLTKSGKINTAGASVITAVRTVNTVGSKPTVNHPRLISNAYKRGYSQVTGPFNKYSEYKNNIFNKKVNTVRVKDTTVGDRVVGNPQQKEYMENELLIVMVKVEFLEKNNVLFTDTECLVLSSDFKLLDESQVLLRVPRKDNIYSVDLKSVVPTKGLTCLFAKATIDESNLWHMRLGHINFKNMNKLVRKYLVRGLPSKIFKNDHSCVAYQKGKQHKASCKAKLVNSISKPLHMLHMDLFGPTNVKSLMKKSYCLVVTDDFSRFSCVFLLATKDETSGILKTFITEIENQLDHKVKVIRCDNGTEFKNSVMNQFCEIKGIKREFSVARTPQQNGVAERRNRTLIEAARTIFTPGSVVVTPGSVVVTTGSVVVTPGSVVVTTGSVVVTPGSVVVTTGSVVVTPGSVVVTTSSVVVTPGSIVVSTGSVVVTTGSVVVYFLNVPNVFSIDDTRIFGNAYDDEDVGAAADLNNLETTMNVSPIPTTRFDKDHPKDQIIGDLTSAIQIRRMTKISDEHAMKEIQALEDPSWIEALQEELLQFQLQKVWTLVNLPNGKTAIGTKWVFRNKKDERGIVIRNKARLVTHSYTQEEGIDYDEVFAPVARIEEIRLFLAYASFMGFIVYQMDVKSAFLYGTIEEEVYVCQPPGFEDPQFLDKVYKVEKALYGLHQAPRAWYETFSTYLIENRFKKGTIDKTLFINKDKGDILLVHVYVDDIIFGSTKKSLCDEFEGLMHKRFQMSSIGELTFFLGLQV